MPNKFSKVGAQQVPALGGSSKMSRDPKRNQTVLHLSTLGAIRGEQNNTFVDDSPNRYTITRTGNVAPSTFTPFGDSWSNYFDGSGDYLSVADNAALEMGSGDFTMEAWINIGAYQTTINSDSTIRSAIITKENSYTLQLWSSNTTSWGGLVLGYHTANTSWQAGLAIAYQFQLNVWYHIAASRQGSSFRFFINGSMVGSTQTISGTLSDYANAVTIGGRTTAGYLEYFNGYISNVRIVKGTALYTSSFTPSKSPLTAVSGTSLLTCASNRFQDKSSNNFTITPAGNVAVKTASPFPQAREFKKPQRGWCIPFNGSTQRLETPAASVANGLQLGTSDFTIEFWVKAKQQNGQARPLDTGYWNNSNYAWGFYAAESPGTFTRNVSFTIVSGNTGHLYINFLDVFDNSWNHISVVRSGDTISGYKNGVLVSSQSIPTVARNLNYTTPVTIGVYKDPVGGGYSSYFSGKISNVMIVKKALYSSNFVPMQSPRTADQTGTLPVLLACQGGSVIDYSYSSHTLTSAGSLVVDSDGPFDQDDELSYYFDGNGDYLSIADNAALEIGSGDFTMECWVNPTALNSIKDQWGYGYASILSKNLSTYGFFIVQKPGSSWWDRLLFHIRDSATNWYNAGFDYAFEQGKWYHLAVSRQSGILRFFVNGSLIGSQSFAYTAENNASALMVGGVAIDSSHFFQGYISNLRLVAGTALYTSSFTPSRKPLPAVSGTSLLTCRGRTAADDSTSALTVTVYGTAGTTANPVSRKSPFRDDERYGMSYYFDGSGDYLTANPAVTTPFAFGTGDFTIEGWIFPTSLTPSRNFVADFRATTSTVAPTFEVTSAGIFKFYFATTLIGSSTGTVKVGQWTHFAISRSGTSLKVFLNGVQEISATNSSSVVAGGATRPIIGSDYGIAFPFTGYISGFSVQKGVAKYTANFTPSTSAQLTVDYSQSLLLNAYPAIYDTTCKNAIETVGSYAAANIGPPWGARAERYANYFGGSTANDCLKIPYSPDLDLGAGDFTIETWVYIAGNSAADGSGTRTAAILTSQASDGREFGFNIIGNASTTGTAIALSYYNGTSYTVTAGATTTISQSVWHHIAISRSGSSIRIFLNGTQVGTTISNSANITSNSEYRIGMWNHPTLPSYYRYFFGGLYDLRITKGFARYTANFTLPRSPLPIK